jgi:MinD-like ATPase involved in chromosome partitioning or flagellar assembly
LYTITFYSFKGGVGRTMALANVAAQLARMGRKVLLVDFDLEAPGLETFERLRPPQPHAGVVEYVTEYRRAHCAPDVREYIYSAGSVGKKGGQLWVMPAGRRDATYQSALAKIDWIRLYRDEDGFLLLEDTKAQWEQEFKPDYVLIDSRTGHTDVKGICTRQLPDVVVVLFFPNEQNLVGLRAVCQEIRSEREQGLKKNIGLHFVMSNVPDLDDEDKVLQRRLRAFEKELGIRKLSAVIHRYESTMLFNQVIFVLDRPRSRLAREYRKLTRVLMRYNPADREGARQFLFRSDPDNYYDILYRSLWSEDLKMVEQGLPAGEDLVNKILEHHPDDADLIYEVASSEYGGEIRREDAETVGLLDRVLTVRPDHPHALYDRAKLKRREGDVSGAVTDLIQYLRDHGFESPHGFSALQDLREAAPDRLLEAVECAVTRAIRIESKHKLARFLAETDAGLPRAIEFMRDYLADESNTDPNPNDAFLLQSYLLRSQRWGEVIDLYESEAHAANNALPWLEVFNVAMAHWARNGTVPEGVSKGVRQQLEKSKEKLLDQLGQHEPLVCRLDAEYWLLYWSGDNKIALQSLQVYIEHLEQWMKEQNASARRSWWSFWLYRGVQLSQYLDDCQQLRRMIQGEPIRPPFLGKPGAPGGNDATQTH